MWPTSDPYLALEDSSRTSERAHHLWRRRYRIGSDTHELPPKRRGRAWLPSAACWASTILTAKWRSSWESGRSGRSRQADLGPLREVKFRQLPHRPLP